jgi:hypothetical protein
MPGGLKVRRLLALDDRGQFQPAADRLARFKNPSRLTVVLMCFDNLTIQAGILAGGIAP